MLFFRRPILVIGVVLATCAVGQAQTTGYHPPTSIEAPAQSSILSVGSVPSSEVFQDRNPPGWVSGGDPVGIPGEKGEILDPRFYPPPGWFASVETGIVKPHLLNQVNGQVPIGGGLDTVKLPTAPLDWTATPRVGVGYRFANAGELIFSYQSLISSGTTTLPNFDAAGNGSLHSRLNMNVANLDWVSLENSFGPDWGMKWRAGIVYTNAYFDSTGTGQMVTQRTANLINTAGVHTGLELNRALPFPGLSLFGRMDGMFMVGPVNQSVEETIGTASGRTNNIYIPGVNSFTNTATPLVLTLEGGVSYTPVSAARWLRLTAAYHFEQWWDVGMPLSSDVQLTIQGIVFRAEITF
jgi:hypothetical protein